MRLTSKKIKFLWTETEDQAFKETKKLFIEANVLEHPDPNREFYLQTDASEIAIGGHLYQHRNDGTRAALVFLSRVLQPAEKRFTTSERELLSIVYCLQKVRHLVLGAKLTIITDNHALTFLKTCRLLNSRLTRWILAIQDYNFNIKHCKGTDNPVADALSRMEPEQTTLDPTPPEEEFIVAKFELVPDPELLNQLQNLSTLQVQDPILNHIYQTIRDGPASPDYQKLSQNFKLRYNILYKNHRDIWLICIPETLVSQLIWACHHYYMHCGSKKCFDMLRESFTFKNMGRRIRTTLATCDTCQRCKSNTHPLHGEARGIKCTGKNEQLSIDIIGPLPTSRGNVKYILIVLDIFTKFVKLYPLRAANTRSVVNKLFGIHFLEQGVPKRIQSDNASQFKSKAWLRKLEEYHITPIFNPVYHPKSNMAERPIKEVKRCLRTYCAHNHKNWSTMIPPINQFLNEITHETTGFSPNELQYGEKDHRFWEHIIVNPFAPNLPIERKLELAKLRIRSKQQKRAEKLNSKHRPTRFEIDDEVLVRSHPISNQIYGETAKLFEIYQGPFKISATLGRATYYVYSHTNNQTYGPLHVSALKRYLRPIANQDMISQQTDESADKQGVV